MLRDTLASEQKPIDTLRFLNLSLNGTFILCLSISIDINLRLERVHIVVLKVVPDKVLVVLLHLLAESIFEFDERRGAYFPCQV